jgi:hypothetical protein
MSITVRASPCSAFAQDKELGSSSPNFTTAVNMVGVRCSFTEITFANWRRISAIVRSTSTSGSRKSSCSTRSSSIWRFVERHF